MIQIVLFLAAFGVVYLCSWGFFVSLGTRKGGLLPTKETRDVWLSSQPHGLIKAQNITAIIGTLTSFATVFIFYLVNAKKFGFFIFATVVALFFSYRVTAWVTTRIIQQSHLRSRSIDADQVGAAVAKMFWSPAPDDKHISLVVQIISLMSVLGIVWLEFSVLTKYLTLITSSSLSVSLGFLFILSLGVFWFTIKYGVRGFVFADLVHVPIIIVCFTILALAAIIAFLNLAGRHPPVSIPTSFAELIWPTESFLVCTLFVMHVFAVNLFLPLAMESHWLRLWAFKEHEITSQKPALTITAILPLFLIIAGTTAFYLLINSAAPPGASPDDHDRQLVITFVNTITDINPVFSFIFWVAAIGALFSTADTQIYAAVVLSQFDPRTGEMNLRLSSPMLFAFLASVLFVLSYGAVEHFEVQFNKIVYTIVPSALIVLPSIIDVARGFRPSVLKLYAAALAYWGASIYGLVAPAIYLEATFAAVLIPVLLSCLPGRKEEHSHAQVETSR